MYLTGYSLLILLLLFAGITPFLLMGLSQVVQIKYPGGWKNVVYESGMTPFGDSHVQFDVKFYMYALLFILFDIETVFLYPWGVAFSDLIMSFEKQFPGGGGMLPILEMFVFIGILIIGLVYAWRRDALRWQ
ncbi:MAG TPA: NADH-quinone oxidoreductase subunit A [Coleofasciculaceae cyanobacterium]|jgi:NADH:ubiquinone oxidoreductase subunit 3 (subunit A)